MSMTSIIDLIAMDESLLLKIREYIDSVDDNFNYITPKELHGRYKEEDLFLLDIRKAEDYRKGHIPGARNIFWLDLFKEENLDKLPKDKKIILICYVGHTASQVMVLLRLLGYDVNAMKFGMGVSPKKEVPIAGWNDFKYELEK